MPRSTSFILIGILAVLATYVLPTIKHEIMVIGIGRTVETTIPNTRDFNKIMDTVHCEDVHHYLPANILFTACEDSHIRFSWFPPLGTFKQPPPQGAQGSIHVVDPVAMASTRLDFENFDKTFVTHGIDVIADPRTPDAVYVFAVNHHPNPEWVQTKSDSLQKSNSQIELFHHIIGSKTIRHIRTVSHPLIRTPNDIYATSPNTFYVTNDHKYREGAWRTTETLLPTAWSDTVYVTIKDLSPQTSEEGVEVSVALTGLKNNNGLGHGRGDEVMVASAERGILYLAQAQQDHNLTIKEIVPLDSCLDNPSWYSDPYATPGDDASGYVLAGLARGIDLAGNVEKPDGKDPAFVWFVRKNIHTTGGDQWEKKLILADDGSRIRTASAAVVVGIDPALEGGKKKGWLFVTGFMSEHMIATKIVL